MAHELAEFYKNALQNDCIPFWFPSCVDNEHGGYRHFKDASGSVFDDDKSVWAQGRIAWMLLTLYNFVERKPEYLAWAESGLRFLEEKCTVPDAEPYRLFFHVTRDGRPIRKRRYAYSESFAAIAFAAHAKATGSAASAEKARAYFDLFTTINFTPGRMAPKYEPTRPLIGLGPRMITLVTAQELALNLGDDDGLRAWRDKCVSEIERFFVKDDLRRVMEAVAPDGSIVDSVEGRTLNPGHSIEGGWFIMHEGWLRNDRAMIELGLRMVDYSWETGWDDKYGGITYMIDVFGKPCGELFAPCKLWWVHDEALIATLMAFRLTGDDRHLARHEQVRKWAFDHFADPQHGEWFGYLHYDGTRLNDVKGNLWKSFFHHPRALWLCMRLADGAWPILSQAEGTPSGS